MASMLFSSVLLIIIDRATRNAVGYIHARRAGEEAAVVGSIEPSRQALLSGENAMTMLCNVG